MADGFDAAVATELTGGIQEVNAHLQALENQSGGTSLDGVTEIKSDFTEANAHLQNIENVIGESLGKKGGWFSSTLDKILGHNEDVEQGDKEARELQQGVIDSLGDMIDYNEVTSKETKMDKKKKGKVGSSSKFDDLKDLPWEFATLGAVLSNAITNKDKDKKGGGISGFFKGLMEGVGGIAALGVALLAFAGAALIFNFVDWGKAVIGMLAFTVFIIGMVAIAKVLAKDQKNLVEFAKASLIMSAALGVFAISLWLTSAVVSAREFNLGPIHIAAFDIKSALLGIGMFLLFELGLAGIARLIKKDMGDFTNFAKGSILMSAALVAFSLALVVVSNVMAAKEFNILGLHLDAIDLKQAMIGVGLFLGFELGLAIVARIAGQNMGEFMKFAGASLLMTVALVAFTLSLVVVSGILTNGVHIGEWNLPAVDLPMAIAGVGLFLGFLLAVVGITFVAQNFMGQIAIFGAISLLMSASLILFSFAMIAASLIFGGEADLGPLGHFSVPEGSGLKAIGAIALFAGFMAAFAGLGMLFMIPFAGAAMAAGIAIASGILLSIGMVTILMANAMALAGLVATGGEMEWAGKRYKMEKADIKKINDAFRPMADKGGLIDLTVDLGAKVKKNLGWFGAVAIANLGMIIDVIDKMAHVIAESMLVKVKVEKEGGTWDTHVMDGCLDYVLEVVDKLAVVAGKMSWFAAIKMPIIAKSMIPIIEAMDKIVDVIEKALTMRLRLEREGVKFSGPGTIDPKILNGICDPVLQVLLGPNMDGNGGLAGAADSMGFWGALMLPKITSAMVPIAETISILVDTIEKAATLGGNAENAKKLIDQGIDNMTYLMVGDGSTESSGALWWKKETITGGFVGMFNTIVKGVEKIGSSADSLHAMKDLAEDLVAVFEAVAKIQGIDIGDVGSVVAKFGEMLGQKSSWSISFSWRKGFTVEKNKATGLMGIIEALSEVDSKDLKTASENASNLKGLVEGIAAAMEACKVLSGDGFAELAGVPDFSNFKKQMDKFDDGMKYLAKGYERVKDIPNNWLDKMGDSFERISQANLNNLDKMAAFSEKASALGKTADNIERIASALKKVNKENAANALSAGADTLFSAAGNILDSIADKVGGNKGKQDAAKSNSKTPVELQKIATIISKWDTNGVKVYGLGDTEEAKEKAVRTLSI